MGALKIIGATILAFVIYGIVHDQVTARVCIEYFTIGHPHPAFLPDDHPTLIGLYWGVIATWWAGLPIGVFLAMASRLGKWPPLCVRDLLRPGLVVMIATGICALIAGIIGFFAAEAGWVWMIGRAAQVIDLSKESAYLANLWAHTSSYAFGVIFSLGLCAWIIWWRRKLQVRYNVI